VNAEVSGSDSFARLSQGKNNPRDPDRSCSGGNGSVPSDRVCHGSVAASRFAAHDGKPVGIADRGPGEIRDVAFAVIEPSDLRLRIAADEGVRLTGPLKVESI